MTEYVPSLTAGPDDCPICLSRLSGVSGVTTSCNHRFHMHCLAKVALTSPTPLCPICRAAIDDMLREALLAAAAAAATAPAAVAAAPAAPDAIAAAPAPAVEASDSPVPVPVPAASSEQQENDPVDREAIERAALSAASSADNAASPLLQLHAEVEFSEVAAADVATIFGMVSVKAAALMDGSELVRAPLDIVVVVDKSRSMKGKKLSLLKKTLQFVTRVLTPADRLSLVEFSHSAAVLCPLWRCSYDRKRAINDIIDAVVVETGTDIASGLRAGVSVLQARTESNSVAAVLLLTDGQDAGSLNHLDEIIAHVPKGTQVHCFGFGADHDALVMSRIAERCYGTFSFIAALEDVQRCFAATLGGLSSTVATDIDIAIALGEAGVLAAVHSKFPHSIAADARSASVKINDMFGDEQRDVVFSFTVPDGDEDSVIEAIKCSLTFLSPGCADVKRIVGETLTLRRPAVATPTPNLRVNAQRNRVHAAAALDEATSLCNMQKFDEARDCLNRAIKEISHSVSADDRLCRKLVADLEKAMLGMRSKSAYDVGGYATAAQMSSTHNQQRQTVSADERDNDDNVSYGYNPYQNAYFEAMMENK
jgi:Mg-chelatase subunit ChlD